MFVCEKLVIGRDQMCHLRYEPMSYIPSAAKTVPRPLQEQHRKLAKRTLKMIRYPLLLLRILLFLKLWRKTLWRKFGEVGYVGTYGESCMIISETPSRAVPSFSMHFRISAKTKEYNAFRDLKSVRHPSLKVLRQWNLVERSVDFVRSDGACGMTKTMPF
ncbi:hypothetical protein PoB_000349500 [Plakobranchus ocellatus]|uniref:Protein kinase domain-containing protein n=1 Tax=Plakobranchus ocellatus TaxID=259542 RepID=A0AAV3Y2W3_9GAST|nr:hypothetical protein PoB_000349500 [Plakobranchus ocellatus]